MIESPPDTSRRAVAMPMPVFPPMGRMLRDMPGKGRAIAGGQAGNARVIPSDFHFIQHLRRFIELVDETLEGDVAQPAETEDCSRDEKFPHHMHFRVKPDGGQCEWRQGDKHQHDESGSEIPRQRLVPATRQGGRAVTF